MMTLEQYLNVATMWIEENDPDFNPFDVFDQSMFDNQSMRDVDHVSQSEIPGADYEEGQIQRQNTEEDEIAHGEQVKKEFLENN